MKAATLENNSDANYRGISTAFGSSPVSLTSINHVKRRSGQYDQVKLSREKQLLQQVKIIWSPFLLRSCEWAALHIGWLYNCLCPHVICLQAIFKSASNSNSQIDKTQNQYLACNSKTPNTQGPQKRRIKLKEYNQQDQNIFVPEGFGDDLVDIDSQNIGQPEHTKSSLYQTVSSPMSNNCHEIDNGSNFDDVSSCASDSAIGRNIISRLCIS